MSSGWSRVAVLGAGNLGSALAKALANSGYDVVATGRRESVLSELRKICEIYDSNKKAVGDSDVYIITVKPKDVIPLLKEIEDPAKGKIGISFSAMIRLEEMRRVTNSTFVRAMTNLFAEYGKGYTVYYGEGLGRREINEIETLLKSFGDVRRVNKEKDVDVMTAFSGSSPALVAKIIESFVYAGLKCGLNAEISKEVAISVLSSTAEYLKNRNELDLIRRITTPGGTTIEGLSKMLERGVDYGIISALESTVNKALKKVDKP
jgi:pyrroline-5-carboxylate reductase